MFFFCGSDIGKDFPIAKDLSENPADTGIIITNLFIGKRKICFNRKSLPMFGGTSSAAGMCRSIHDRINPCIVNQIQIRIFINDGYQILFCIPAVTKDDDMIFAVKFRHNLPDHGGCQFQFRYFFFLDVSVIYLYAVVSDRKGNIMLQKLYVFFRKETVLSIAVILALLSMFWVRPDKAYFTYIDFRTLGLLFCLMAIVAGLKAVGVFDILAKKLLMGTSGTVGVIRLLVLLCFFLSMVITNDVALITFVPLALIIVHKLPKELGNYWLLKIVAMQTIAANLGSMLTPIGNPQNLYLYARAGMSAAELITLMLPYSATALILLLIWIQVADAKAPHVCGSEKDKTLLGFSDRKELNMEYLAAYLILFTICLLTVARIIPYQIPLVLVLIYMLLRNRENISRVDYSLLATFIALFIFIGNLGRIPQFSSFLERIMAGRETLTAVLASQIMSNVPAALLLSGFTDNYRALIVGTNIGGLGTLIASMASLISFKYIAKENRNLRGKYLGIFTASNIIFMIFMLILYFFLR